MASNVAQLDPQEHPFLKVRDLTALGFGDAKTIYGAIARDEIPVVRVGRKVLIPTAWVRRTLQLDPPAA
jgi:hypothetical protein